MSIDWFRSWHGAPTDPKWLLIARNAMKRSETHETQITPGMVSAVVWALFDHASQAEQRGNVDGFDVETYAMFSGFDEANIAAIIEALKEKNLIISGTLSAWEKRQPKREDNSTERVRTHRNAVKRNVTQGNAREDKEKSREEKKDAAPSGAQVVLIPQTPEKIYFDQAVQYLGNNARSLAAQLLKAKGNNIPAAHQALLAAVQKSNPREYIGAIIRGRGSTVDDLRARGEAW
jgi:hypothetical protein